MMITDNCCLSASTDTPHRFLLSSSAVRFKAVLICVHLWIFFIAFFKVLNLEQLLYEQFTNELEMK